MEQDQRLVAAIWLMYGAIRQLECQYPYDEHIKRLSDITHQAMVMSNQIEDKEKTAWND